MKAFDFAGRTKLPRGPQVGKPCSSGFVWNQVPCVGIITWSNDVLTVLAYRNHRLCNCHKPEQHCEFEVRHCPRNINLCIPGNAGVKFQQEDCYRGRIPGAKVLNPPLTKEGVVTIPLTDDSHLHENQKVTQRQRNGLCVSNTLDIDTLDFVFFARMNHFETYPMAF